MGCFDETCAMTRLPINNGNDIVYVGYKAEYIVKQSSNEVFKHLKHICNTASLMGMLHQQSKLYNWNNKDFVLVDVKHGKYDDYGRLETSANETYPIEALRKASLSDNEDTINFTAYFFLHAGVWDAYKEPNHTCDYETLYEIVQAAYTARIQLFANYRLVGQQHANSTYVEERLKLDRVSNHIMKDLLCYQFYMEEEGSLIL